MPILNKLFKRTIKITLCNSFFEVSNLDIKSYKKRNNCNFHIYIYIYINYLKKNKNNISQPIGFISAKWGLSFQNLSI